METQHSDKCNIYMDLSGDPGFNFARGSTPTLTSAALLENQDWEAQNRKIVLDAKELIGCHARDELKYTTVKRKGKQIEVLRVLSRLRVNLYSLPYIKTRVTNLSTTDMNVVAQAMPILNAMEHMIGQLGVKRVNIYADASNPTLEKMVSELVAHFRSDEKKVFAIDGVDFEDIEFVNSASNQMIQAADIFAGAIAEFAEANMDRLHAKCRTCNNVYRGLRRKRECSGNKPRRRTQKVELFDEMRGLFACDANSWIIPSGFWASPDGKDWSFIDCI